MYSAVGVPNDQADKATKNAREPKSANRVGGFIQLPARAIRDHLA